MPPKHAVHPPSPPACSRRRVHGGCGQRGGGRIHRQGGGGRVPQCRLGAGSYRNMSSLQASPPYNRKNPRHKKKLPHFFEKLISFPHNFFSLTKQFLLGYVLVYHRTHPSLIAAQQPASTAGLAGGRYGVEWAPQPGVRWSRRKGGSAQRGPRPARMPPGWFLQPLGWIPFRSANINVWYIFFSPFKPKLNHLNPGGVSLRFPIQKPRRWPLLPRVSPRAFMLTQWPLVFRCLFFSRSVALCCVSPKGGRQGSGRGIGRRPLGCYCSPVAGRGAIVAVQWAVGMVWCGLDGYG